MSEQRRTTIEQELKRGASVTYFTVGISMQPLLKERQTHVTIAPPVTFRPGDIVLYLRPDGSYVLHRCIKRKGQDCYMRGDNTYGLEWVPYERVIGVVTHIYRRGRMFAVQENKAYRAYVVFWRLCYPFRWLRWRLRELFWRVWRIMKGKK